MRWARNSRNPSRLAQRREISDFKNSKSEFRISKQARMKEGQNSKPSLLIWTFAFRHCFGFRASDLIERFASLGMTKEGYDFFFAI